MKQQKLINEDILKPEWIIDQFEKLGMTYTEMSNRMGVNRSTLYRFRKGIHRSERMKQKIIDLFNNPYYGVALFFIDTTSPHLKGKVYPVVYCEQDLQRLVNIDIENTGGIVVYSKFVKRFTSVMIEKHQSIAIELAIEYEAPFPDLSKWLIEQIRLIKTQKTRDKTVKLLNINLSEEI